MTPKYKAKQLFEKIYFEIQSDELGKCYESAKQCALIAVEEIMNALPPFTYGLEFVAKIDYWKEVKKEIETL